MVRGVDLPELEAMLGGADDEGREAAYAREATAACRRGVRIANLVSVAIVPLLVWVDYRMAGALVPAFVWGRVAVLAVMLGVQWGLGTAWGARHPQWLGLVGAGSSAALNVFFTLSTGGYDSPYNPGVGVVVLVTALLVPWSLAWSLRLTAVVALLLLARAALVPATGPYVLGSLFGVALACTFATVAAAMWERRRRTEFGVRWTLARLADRLRRLDRLKSELVSVVSHEMRTPLQVVLGFAEILREPSLGAEERLAFVAKIEESGRQLLELIDSTLTVARLEAGQEDTAPQPVSLQAFWRSLQDRCALMPHAPEVEMVFGGAPDVELYTDPWKLGTALRNLVGNALKFTERGSVAVTAREQSEHLVVEVADTGIGVRAEERDAIFEMFQQVDGSSTRRYEGVGLGLYIVRRFVQQLGGQVALDSTVGAGSTFTITIPKRMAGAAGGRAA